MNKSSSRIGFDNHQTLPSRSEHGSVNLALRRRNRDNIQGASHASEKNDVSTPQYQANQQVDKGKSIYTSPSQIEALRQNQSIMNDRDNFDKVVGENPATSSSYFFEKTNTNYLRHSYPRQELNLPEFDVNLVSNIVHIASPEEKYNFLVDWNQQYNQWLEACYNNIMSFKASREYYKVNDINSRIKRMQFAVNEILPKVFHHLALLAHQNAKPLITSD